MAATALTPEQIGAERLRLLQINRESYDRSRMLLLQLIREHGATEAQKKELSAIERLHSAQFPQHGDSQHH